MLPCLPGSGLTTSSESSMVSASSSATTTAAPIPIPPIPPVAPLPGVVPMPGMMDMSAVIPASDARLESPKRYFVNQCYRSHGKQWLSKCLRNNYGLKETKFSQIPDNNVVFYWIQREYAYSSDRIFDESNYTEYCPCIAFIPSQSRLCNKVEMARTLKEYYGEKQAWQIHSQTMDLCWDPKIKDWRISDQVSYEIEKYDSKHPWIVKSNAGSLGNQVFIFVGNSIIELRKFLTSKYEEITTWMERSEHWAESLNTDQLIIQEYIDRPLLIKGLYKFDIRCYLLIASTNPCIAFFHRGKMRICAKEYHSFGSDISVDWMSDEARFSHLSNCSIQRKHDDYRYTDQTIDGVSMLGNWDDLIDLLYFTGVQQCRFGQEWLEEYSDISSAKDSISEPSELMEDCKDEEKCDSKAQLSEDDELDFEMGEKKTGISRDMLSELLSKKCRRRLGQMVDSVASFMDADSVQSGRRCQFGFYGVDLLIDELGHFWLIECNRCASISLNGHSDINEMTKVMLSEMLDIEMEIRSLKMEGIRVDQQTGLCSVREWEPIQLEY